MAYPVIIAAMASNGVMGNSQTNSLPWPRQSDDMEWFRQVTMNHHVVMGHKTFMSLRGIPLEGRVNCVLSSVRARPSGSLQYCTSFGDLHDWMQYEGDDVQFFVIGGKSLFDHYLPLVNEMLLTVFDFEAEGDIMFPEFDRAEWNAECVQNLENGNIWKFTRINPVDMSAWNDPSSYDDDDDDDDWEYVDDDGEDD